MVTLSGSASRNRDAPTGFLLLIGLVMVWAIAWSSTYYRLVPDAAGRVFAGCAVQVAGFAWVCG